ncbi:MAG: sulfatase-like hydrolase/transferase [Acidobacteria bacterium]|nr:sulfatase-like hydrolase/transferase [Acidobacteriota bacterium]
MLDSIPSAMQALARFLLIVLVAQYALATPPKNAKGDTLKAAKAPNLILITLDTTRADRMGFLGSKRGLTPNLDALAQQSAIFVRAYSQVPLTTPSHAAMLTGTYPQFNQLEDLGMPLAKDLPWVPSLLHQRGYHTAAFLGANILDAKGGTAPGFDRGFDLYDTDFHDAAPGDDRYHSIERRAGDVADRALRWLSQTPQGPFFIWLHFYDAHDPYDPPSPFKERYPEAPYDGEIAYTDSVVGRLVDALRQRGLFDNSLIAIAADHGEAFGEHGEERHGMFLYDETIRVPLLLKLPQQKLAGRKVDPRVALVDLAPTLLQAAGMTVPATMQGSSLFSLLESDESSPGNQKEKDKPKDSDRAIFSSSSYARRVFGASELRSWRSGKYLYVQSPKRELYDLPLDPSTSNNLASSSQAVADTLDTQVSGFLQKTSSTRNKNAKLDPSVVEKLRALGYLASENNAVQKSGKAAIDPKDLVDVANRYHRALIKGEEGHYDQQITELRDIVAHNPDLPGAQYNLGVALIHEGKFDDAVPFLRSASEQFPDSPSGHYQLGLAFIYLGKLDEALREMQAAVVCLPSSANLHSITGTVHLRLGQIPAAMKEYAKAIELDPTHFEATFSYGRLLLMQGRTDAALVKLTRASKLNPQSADAHMALADVYTQMGQTAAAQREVKTYERLRAASPQ